MLNKYKLIKYNRGDLKAIQDCNHEWDSPNLKKVMEDIRTYLETEFNNRCFYCQRNIDTGTVSPEIDHFLYKDKYTFYTYRPENLILSCKLCNTYKGTYDAFNPLRGIANDQFAYNDYSNYTSSNFKMIHAYYDNYDDHIELVMDLFLTVKNGSAKGEETYNTCKLYRLNIAENRMRDIINFGEFSLKTYSKTNKYEEYIKQITADLENYSEIYPVIKDRKVKAVAKVIESKKGHLYINNNSANLYKFFSKNMKILEGYNLLLNYIKNSRTFIKALGEYKLATSGNPLQVEDLLDLELMSGFKIAYESKSITNRIHPNIVSLVMKTINNIYLVKNNYRRLKILISNKAHYECIKSIVNKIYFIENKEYLRRAFKDKINTNSELFALSRGINDHYYAVGLIPVLLEC